MGTGIFRIILAVLFFLFLVLAIGNLLSMLNVLNLQYSIDYSEGVIVLTKLHYLYKSFDSYPYLITYYPPLYYLFVAALRSAYSAGSIYFYTRFIGLASVLGSALMMYLITRKILKGKSLLSLFAPVLFLSSLIVPYLGMMPDPSATALFFDLLGLFLIIDYKGMRQVVFASVALLVAFFIKQDAILFAVAVAIYLLLNGKRRDLALFGGIFVAASLIVVIWLNLVSSGRYVVSVFILPFITPFEWANLASTLLSLLFFTPFIPLAFFAWTWISRNIRSPVSIAAACNIMLIVSSGKAEATPIYLFAPLSLYIIAAASGLGSLFIGRETVGKYSALSYTLTLAITYSLAYMLTLAWPASISYNLGAYEVGSSLRALGGNILTENPAVNVAAGKSLLFEPSEFWAMQEHGLWNDSHIVHGIENRSFAAIVVPENGMGRFGYYPNIVNAIDSNYHINNTGYDWDVYVPDARSLT
ncbi:MAG: hypothetical protein M1569_01230 [Candidatus Marsarchaeota archaeon]|nr:hypothetical protein [Candidatus Marsarchaeota archaeon]MCL5413011.1 hypothetical protein [Candidatus Marsarchaeota archaeon]